MKKPTLAYLAGTLLIPFLFALLANKWSATGIGDGKLQFSTRVLFAIASPEVWKALGATLARFSLGFGLAVLGATVLGLAMGRIKRLEEFLMPLVSVLKPIPSAAVIPFAMFMFAYGGISMKLFVITYGVFWPVLIYVLQGAKDIDPILVETGRTLGKSESCIFFEVVVPATLPAVLLGARVALAIGLLLAVTTEILIASNPSGIGYLILDYERLFKHPEMVGAIFVLGIVGWGLDFFFREVEKLCLPWHHGRS